MKVLKKYNFSKEDPYTKIPDLLTLQKKSFTEFLQNEIPPEKRKLKGLQQILSEVFPIVSNDERISIEYVNYQIDNPLVSAQDSMEKKLTYSAPLKVLLKMTIKREKKKPLIKQQEVFLCDLPMLTENATFIINGAERIVVSQLHRSPGILFEEDEQKRVSIYGKPLYFARIIPYRGAWIEFEFDMDNLLYVRLDRRKRFLATTFLRACGISSNEEILKLFYPIEEIDLKKTSLEEVLNRVLAEDVINFNTGEVIGEANQRINKSVADNLFANNIDKIKVLVISSQTNDITITETLRKDVSKSSSQAILDIFRKLKAQEYIGDNLAKDFVLNMFFKPGRYDLSKVGRYKINRKLKKIFEEKKLTVPSENHWVLTKEDIIATIQYLLNLNNNLEGEIDDIDHLGNRRVRAVGELIGNQLRIGLLNMVRLTKNKLNMTSSEEEPSPREILNTAPVNGMIKKFFGTGQLTQFMDGVNPLAELTHKRRLSALGPGGLHRKRAGFEVRDVHYSHFGRICPIETPEGANIGLITSLALYAQVNQYGLIETPYKKVEEGKVTNKIVYLLADEEETVKIAPADVAVDENGKIIGDEIQVFFQGGFPYVHPKDVDYIAISPFQMVGVSAGLIPFLEHDDANRALMGSNMQRQAVPLVLCEPPLVGTGIEGIIARDSGIMVIAKEDGIVEVISGEKIITYNPQTKTCVFYPLKKNIKTNQETCFTHRPLVKIGDKVKKGDILADGMATSQGQLSLGKNVLIAFMPWRGYNFEDAIIASERLVYEDVFTSIYLRSFEIETRELKVGREEITRDIPNVGEDILRNLDDEGIVRVGAWVKPGDILVGKVTPRGETQTTPEERLLRAIFGKKAEDVQDASLRVPPGVEGKVINIQIFRRKGVLSKSGIEKNIKQLEEKYKAIINLIKKDAHQKEIQAKTEEEKQVIKQVSNEETNLLKKELQGEKERIKNGDALPLNINQMVKVTIAMKRKLEAGDKLSGRHGNKGVVSCILPVEDMPYLEDGTPIDLVLNPLGVPSRMNLGQIYEAMLGWVGEKTKTQFITPIFESPSQEEINTLLEQQGLPENAKTTLYDGCTGEPFENKVTVGYLYMMKLIHMAEDKIFARSTGPYSLITRQPLGGKAHAGGQRFGEMEVWALEGYGAAYTLQEFLTIKSDDVGGRVQLYESILKDQPIKKSGVTEAFKVLVKELESLCLKVELL